MSERVVRQRVKRELIRYRMETRPGLTAEEVELYAMAAIDEVSLACLLVQVGNARYDDTLREAPHTPQDFANYRRFISVVSVTYQNPWEWVFEVLGTAAAVATAIQTMYHLRSSRRKIEAETELIRAQAEKVKAETRTLDATTEGAQLGQKLAANDKALKQAELADFLMSRERQDRTTREFLAEVVLRGKHEWQIHDIDYGIRMLKGPLASSLFETMEQATGPVDRDELMVRQQLMRLIADNPRLIASIRRLDEVERSAEALDGNCQD